jgi:DNA-binding MarR family transcriptional regulator
MNGDRAWRFDKSRSAGYLINHLARIFFHGLAERIRPIGLAPGQFMLLLELWREDGLTQRDLVERLDVEQATVANTLARMERDGLIVRRALAGDGRAQSIHVTPKARALEAPATASAQAVNRRYLAALTPREREQFLHLMGKVIAGTRDLDGADEP